MMKFGFLARVLIAGWGSVAFVSSANAAITVYSGFDSGAVAPGSLAIAASNAFNAAVPTVSTINFESFGSTTDGAIGPDYSISSTSFEIRTTPAFGLPALFGANTTTGGTRFAYSNNAAASLVFNFVSPINAFGAFFGGLQTASSRILFSDGTAQSIALGGNPTDGGFSFVGFTSSDASISSVTIDVPFDLISVDDVRFRSAGVGVGGVPEPATWGLMIAGFGGIGAMLRRRRNVALTGCSVTA